ncbi:MAG: twin-arginine translocase subunit TatC [Acidiferrobacteraceae bacterium]
MAQTKKPAEAEGSFVSHLLELRTRVLRAATAVLIVFVALFPFADRLYLVLARPLMAVLPHGASMIATDLPSTFLTPMKLALAVAFAITIPYILYQVWAFVAPGLYSHEKRLVVPLLVSSTALFYSGMAFAYFVIFPVVFRFFTKTAPPGVRVMTDIRSYLNFVFTLFFAFGIAFEIPVALVLLSATGIVNPATLAAKRRYVVLAIFVAAAILAPPDAASMIMLALPMWLLFEIGLFVAMRMHRRKVSGSGDAAADPPQEAATVPAEDMQHGTIAPGPVTAPVSGSRRRGRRRGRGRGRGQGKDPDQTPR